MQRYLLDTNVLSEPMRPRPAATVLRWLDARNPANLFLSAITLGELASGMHRLESSARRRALERWLSDVVVTQFEGRILAFDTDVAWRWGEMIAGAAASGRTRRAIDLQIAATAAHHGLVLVSRNAADFTGLRVEVVNPWD